MLPGNLLSEDLRKLLDILEYRFDLRIKKPAQEGQEVNVFSEDLKEAGMKIESFASALYFFKEASPEIKVLHVYDFVNGENPTPEEQYGVYPPIAELVVPHDFKEKIELFRLAKLSSAQSDRFYWFSLSSDGKLSRKLDNKLEQYSMENNSLRHRLINALDAGAHKFRSTADLADSLEVDELSIRRTVGELRKQIKKNFKGVEGIDFLDGKKNSGYRLGDQIRIIGG